MVMVRVLMPGLKKLLPAGTKNRGKLALVRNGSDSVSSTLPLSARVPVSSMFQSPAMDTVDRFTPVRSKVRVNAYGAPPCAGVPGLRAIQFEEGPLAGQAPA